MGVRLCCCAAVLLFILSTTTAVLAGDPGYRVLVSPSKSFEHIFPPPSQAWTLQYTFTVPPLPTSPTWDFMKQVFYIWGDVDFDAYGTAGNTASWRLSNYRYNQIVPQIILGWGGTSDPSGGFGYFGIPQSPTWFIQADYYWRHDNGTNWQFAGDSISVSPGEVLNETISYNPTNGVITAAIMVVGNASRISQVIIKRPFPNDPSLFSSWRDFFQKAVQKSQTTGPVGVPNFNVETHDVDAQTLCSVLPQKISSMQLPGLAWNASNYATTNIGGFTCSSKSAAKLVELTFANNTRSAPLSPRPPPSPAPLPPPSTRRPPPPLPSPRQSPPSPASSCECLCIW